MEKKTVIAGFTGKRALRLDNMKSFIKHHLNNALFRNAYYLMGSQIATYGLSFVFWVIAARFYATEAIGLAGAIMPMISFIAGLADLGIGFGIIRFLPNAGDREKRMMNTSFSIQILASLIISIIFLAGLKLWSPAMLVLQSNFLYLAGFVLLTFLNVFTAQIKGVFIASSKSKLMMIADLITRGAAISSLLVLASLSGFFGILGAQGVGYAVTLIVCLVIFLPRLKGGYYPRLEIDKGVAKEIMPFSLGNYLGQMVGSIQFWLLPAIILNILGAELNAYFYVGFSLSSAVWMIPASIATSVFVEGSHSENKLHIHLRSGIKLAIILDIIAVVIVFTLGDRILWLFGKQYSIEGLTMLRLFSLAVFPVTATTFLVAWARVKKHIKFLIVFHAVIAAVVISLIYLIAPMSQLEGVGIAYIIGQTSVALGAVAWFLITRKKGKVEVSA